MPFDLSRGIIAAPVTPFNTDESVDWPTLDRYMAEVAAGGPQGIAMNMAASEGGSLTVEEQIEVVRRTKAAAAGSCAVISGVVAQSTGQAKDLSQRLVEAGADALVVFPPLPTFVSKPLPVSAVVDYHRAIADASGVPIIAFQTPFVDYRRARSPGWRRFHPSSLSRMPPSTSTAPSSCSRRLRRRRSRS